MSTASWYVPPFIVSDGRTGRGESVPGEMIRITSKEGKSFAAYLSRPPEASAGGPSPGIVLIQEMLGITPWLKGMADRFAGEGFVVAAPDMFWRMHPGFVGDHANKADYEQAWSYLRSLDYDLAVEDIGSAMQATRFSGPPLLVMASLSACTQ